MSNCQESTTPSIKSHPLSAIEIKVIFEFAVIGLFLTGGRLLQIGFTLNVGLGPEEG